MKTFLAPNGEYITIPDGRVTTFGLSKEQNELVKNALPAKGYELLDTDAPTDLIAILRRRSLSMQLPWIQTAKK